MRDPRQVLIRPLMTEKTMQQKEALNTVAFRVRPEDVDIVGTRLTAPGHKIDLVEGA